MTWKPGIRRSKTTFSVRFVNEPFANSIFELGANGTRTTAIHSLRNNIQKRFQQMKPHLRLMTERKIDEASWRKRIAVAKEAETKRLQEEKQEMDRVRKEFEEYGEAAERAGTQEAGGILLGTGVVLLQRHRPSWSWS